jgi:hypothetical protein
MRSKVVHLHPHRAGHVLEESARPGGTAVVHLEAQHTPAWSHPDDLAVLPANVQHRAGVRVQMTGPKPVRLDLRDYLVSQLPFGRQLPSIAGGNQPPVGAPRDECSGVAHRIGARIYHLSARYALAIPFHQGNGARADVEAGNRSFWTRVRRPSFAVSSLHQALSPGSTRR